MIDRMKEITKKGACTVNPAPHGGMVSGFGEGKMETSFSSPTHTMLNGRNGYTMDDVFNGLGVATGSQETTISELGKELQKNNIGYTKEEVLKFAGAEPRTIFAFKSDGTFKFADNITLDELNFALRMMRELGVK